MKLIGVWFTQDNIRNRRWWTCELQESTHGQLKCVSL